MSSTNENKQQTQTPKQTKNNTHHPEKKKASSELSETVKLRFQNFFWLPAARVRGPGGSPFSQLQQREKDNSTFVKSNKNIHDHRPEQ